MPFLRNEFLKILENFFTITDIYEQTKNWKLELKTWGDTGDISDFFGWNIEENTQTKKDLKIASDSVGDNIFLSLKSYLWPSGLNRQHLTACVSLKLAFNSILTPSQLKIFSSWSGSWSDSISSSLPLLVTDSRTSWKLVILGLSQVLSKRERFGESVVDGPVLSANFGLKKWEKNILPN